MKKIIQISAMLFCIVIAMTSLVGCFGGDLSSDDYLAIIDRSTLDYPASNDEFMYDVYTEYVSISKYIGKSSDVTIPTELEDLPVLSIRDNAFEENSYIKNVVIPEPVCKIGKEAFRACPSLKSVSLPTTLKVIGSDCFRGCDVLSELIIPANVDNIPSGLCSGCESLYNVEILESKNDASRSCKIESSAFAYCHSLYGIYIPKRYTEINDTAFRDSMDNLVIYGYGSGATAKYCSENLINFVVLDAEKYKAIREENKKKQEEAAAAASKLEAEAEQEDNESAENETDENIMGW